ncbi:MAG: hypothetical protein GW938_15520 [Leptospira sp.]|nr:hypothetical protein [Leptospira sp.]
MKVFSWLWTDDKSGKFSDTTFRTWIAFLLFIGCTVYWVWFDSNGIQSQEEILVQTLMFFVLGQGTLFAAKRFNERKSNVITLNSKPSNFKTGEEIYDNEVDRILKERGF